MTDHSRSPRIAPLDPADRSAEADELLNSITVADGSVMNLFATLVRHPGLFRRWLPFGGKLLAGTLPARDREVLILRTSWRIGAEYEWGQHVPVARAAGMSDGEIARLCKDTSWEGFDATLVAAADELHDTARIGDETWAALTERYDERQLIEVPMLVGHYHMVGYALNSLGVQLEDGVAGFPS
jgi:4-carboxymuconolactone decarboxylase